VTLTEFKQSRSAEAPPAEIGALALQALWWAAKGDWHRAHELAQDDKGADGAWVHAYLHRVEGDLSNAGYWYRRAEKPRHSGELAAEWDEIAMALLF
jgi:hypothetical protein